ncbi:spore cortex-lytic enzyme [Viridibacillus sp. YIM B01967]|uniref:Spore cortex-lytic enzyme n=1 Tax=Viridibacillus soli TaxID=2798301 RepID=A0ABS1HDD5_9BACL|nr:spore cortex-lytic enzyme [Viridibacillus soli]MBK3497264.1 spore cortex-lytic enzyme [Viridibacillus soli]
MRLFKVMFIILMTFTIFSTTDVNRGEAFTNQVIARGANGDDVIELQARLQYISYYTEKIDGKFGYGTYWALRKFQEKYGLPVDGIAGASTKKKLTSVSTYHKEFVMEQLNKGNRFTHYGGVALEEQVKKGTGTGTGTGSGTQTNTQLPTKYSDQDLKLMANAVYGESRGEPYEGQVAVAAVILNRLDSPEFPNTISEIIFQPRAFTAVADGQIWLTPNKRAMEAVIDAMNGWDPSENALYYFNPDTATSGWIWTRKQIKTIGQHIFSI